MSLSPVILPCYMVTQPFWWKLRRDCFTKHYVDIVKSYHHQETRPGKWHTAITEANASGTNVAVKRMYKINSTEMQKRMTKHWKQELYLTPCCCCHSPALSVDPTAKRLRWAFRSCDLLWLEAPDCKYASRAALDILAPVLGACSERTPSKEKPFPMNRHMWPFCVKVDLPSSHKHAYGQWKQLKKKKLKSFTTWRN